MTKWKWSEADQKAIEAAKALADYCKSKEDCIGCPFLDHPDCILSRECFPCLWDIPKEEESDDKLSNVEFEDFSQFAQEHGVSVDKRIRVIGQQQKQGGTDIRANERFQID